MHDWPKVALSIRQPWVNCILYCGKDIENRDWRTRYRGPVLLHAAKGVDDDDLGDVTPDMVRGGIAGIAEIVDCVSQHHSVWFHGPFGFVLEKVRPVEFVPCRGMPGLFTPDLDFSQLQLAGL